MSRILVLYGTTDGHTAKIARAVAGTLETEGCTVVLADAATAGRSVTPEYFDAVIVAASVHIGSFQRSVKRWVESHAGVLNSRPTAFLPVCLGILEVNPLTHIELEGIVKRFLDATKWRPTHRHFVAGATPYTRYNLIKRWMIRRIVAKSGGDTDTSRDVEYTNWDDLREFVRGFSKRLTLTPHRRSPVEARV